MLAQCPCFESDQSDEHEYKGKGTARHDYYKGRIFELQPLPEPCPDYCADKERERLEPEEIESVDWAAGFTVMTAGSQQVMCEQKLFLYDDNFSPVFNDGGHLDAVAGNEIFDLKWRERDYGPQVAAYALMLMQSKGYETVTVYILFAERRRIQKLIFDRDSAASLVFGVVARSNDPNKQPTPCDYCGWCANRLRCKALNERVQAVVDGREDWKLGQYHASQINEPAEALKALHIARQVKKWCEGVEFHAKKICDLLTQEELAAHGFRWQDKKGRTFCADVLGAYNTLGLSAEEFLQACDLRLNTSKKYPDKKGAIELFAAKNGMKPTPAKKMVLAKLEPVLKRGEDSRSLVAIGDESTDES
jgi:hypothetical protein